MNDEGIQRVRREFLKAVPDFQDFEHPPLEFKVAEIDYRTSASQSARMLLKEHVLGNRTCQTDKEAREVVESVIKVTNYFSSRAKDFVADLCKSTGDWMALAGLLFACLRGSEAETWQGSLQELLNWLQSKNLRASMTKILPTYFLFLWNPKDHFFVKADFVDRFLTLLGEAPLGRGTGLTVADYQRILDLCTEFRSHIADWKPHGNIDIHSLAWTIVGVQPRASGRSENLTVTLNPQVVNAETVKTVVPMTQTSIIPLNLILAGPPGTGKTHALLTKYVPLFEEHVEQQPLDEFVFEHCAELSWHETCLIGLHLLGHPATVQQLLETEPVKARMKLRADKKYVTNTLWVGMANHTPESCPNVGVNRHFEPAMFWKNKDATWQLVEGIEAIAPDLITLAEQIRNYEPTGTTVRRHEFVTFHQSYSYEDFVEGIKPEMDVVDAEGETSQVQYTVQPGIFARMVRRAMADPLRPYALFVDEINRANISNVFGELITLLEPDKRMTFSQETGEWEGGVRTKLPYTHSTRPHEPLFGVPDNLHVIGTMNSADRSIALLDLALRRRFTFDEYMPDPAILANHTVADDEAEVHLGQLLATMNQRIEYLYDRDHTIGHSYLMGIKTLEELEHAFRRKILPLLQEYFYGDWHKIQMVLGDLVSAEDADDLPKAHPHAIVRHTIQRPKQLFGLNEDAYQERRSYAVSEHLSGESFRKIYQYLSVE